MTTNRLLSYLKCRSIKGSMPLPIDPNPIITIGPVISPYTGQFVIRRNESYWGQPAKIDEVVYKSIQEDAARIAALESGQVDVISNIPPHEVARLKANPRLRVQPLQGLRPLFLVLSPHYKPLDNVKVRRAMTWEDVIKAHASILKLSIAPTEDEGGAR